MNDLIEAAARALAELHGRNPDDPVLPSIDRPLWQEFVPQARAVIIAIRDRWEAKQDAADWAAEYMESGEAGVEASRLSYPIELLDQALEEDASPGTAPPPASAHPGAPS